MNFHLSLFNNIGDNTPRAVSCTWPAFCKTLARPQERQDKDGLLFSAARYARPRRLIQNVVELSMLVLEVDGAWQCEETSMLGDCLHRAPQVQFLNKKTGEVRCPQCKTKPAKIKQIIFEMADLIAAVKAGFPGNAFAIYSTHSHKSVTHSNPKAEPRFRIVLPMATPIPVAAFLPLWFQAEAALTLPIDPQLKNPNAIYYTPVKAFEESVYEWHVEAGDFLKWDGGPSGGVGEIGSRGEGEHESGNRLDASMLSGSGTGADEYLAEAGGSETLSPVSLPPVLQTSQAETENKALPASSQTQATQKPFAAWPARHAELCQRIKARGKRNAAGIYDARCLAHGGKGTTALLYNPAKNSVHCNRGCTYDELLVAEGLPSGFLPDEPIDQTAGGRRQEAAGPLSIAKLHVVYSLLLAHCFVLNEDDEKMVVKHWGPKVVFSGSIAWPEPRTEGHRVQSLYGPEQGLIVGESGGFLQVRWDGHTRHTLLTHDQCVSLSSETIQRDEAVVKVCTLPTFAEGVAAARRLAEHFDLTGVPGFYQTTDKSWALQLPRNMKPGGLLSPYYSSSGYIIGIRIHRSWRDQSLTSPWLLTSRGLPGGARAIRIQEAA